MLALSRKASEQIVIPTPIGPIWITVVSIGDRFTKNKVRLGFQLPDQINVYRAEIFDREKTPETCNTRWGSMPLGEDAA